MPKWKFIKGGSSAIDDVELENGQILFDEDRQRILLDTVIDETLTRIVMTEQDTFVGTTAQWTALTDDQKAVFRFVDLIDDFESISGVMTGATAQADGISGLTPKPLAGDQGKVLYGDGTWKALGDAASKTSTSSVTQNSTDLITSGGVYSYVDTMITQALSASY